MRGSVEPQAIADKAHDDANASHNLLPCVSHGWMAVPVRQVKVCLECGKVGKPKRRTERSE